MQARLLAVIRFQSEGDLQKLVARLREMYRGEIRFTPEEGYTGWLVMHSYTSVAQQVFDALGVLAAAGEGEARLVVMGSPSRVFYIFNAVHEIARSMGLEVRVVAE